jgi:precorrin-6Y C5,15-methyltransferase (decarboxylating)
MIELNNRRIKMKLVSVIGVGMGNPENMTIEARRAIDAADVIIGSQKVVEQLELKEEKDAFFENRSEKIKVFIDNSKYSNYAVVFSGDVCFFSNGKKLLDILDERLYDIRCFQGVSSVAYFASKIGVSWGNTHIVNVRGLEDNIASVVRRNKRVFALTNDNAAKICSVLNARGLGNVNVCVAQRLSFKDEKITSGYACELIDADFDKQTILYIENKFAYDGYISIESDEFVRGNSSVLSKEIRACAMSELALKTDDICYDIGAGNGSMSVEMALAAYKGKVYAVELNSLGTQLILDNCEKFQVDNVYITKGKVNEAVAELPKPDAVFIGNSGGFMNVALDTVLNKGDDIRVVVAAFSLEELNKTTTIFAERGMEYVKIKQLSVASCHSEKDSKLNADTPVFLVSGYKAGM